MKFNIHLLIKKHKKNLIEAKKFNLLLIILKNSIS